MRALKIREAHIKEIMGERFDKIMKGTYEMQ